MLKQVKFVEDPTRGLGDSYPTFRERRINYSVTRILRSPYFKNLTDVEVFDYAHLLNAPFHNAFTMYDLRGYFMQLSFSRETIKK
jgi:hypothetical protein